MIYIGNHLSASKGFYAMGKMALKLGGDTSPFLPEIPEAGRRRIWTRRTSESCGN